MSKTKKNRTPNLHPAVMTRPRLDALFARHAGGADDLDTLTANVRALMSELGEKHVLDALVKRLEGTPEAERETLMLLMPRLKSQVAVDHLWQRVKRSGGLSLDAKMTALVILKAMDEDVDLADPGQYFTARDLRPKDLETAEGLLRSGLRGIARGVRGARDAAEVEAIMHRVQQMPQTAIGGTGVLLHLMQEAESEGTDLAADFVYAMAHTAPYPDVQRAAERALTRLEARGVKPVTRAILDLGKERFYAAYTTDPQHPWQQSVVVGWERAAGVVQGISFLLDFGMPWGGAVKDMFVTRGMSPQEFDRQFKERAETKMNERVYRISLARAQAMIAAAVRANEQNKIGLPKEYEEVRHLVERWVLHPPAAALAADTTDDELAHLPLTIKHAAQPLVLRMEDLKKPAVQQWLAQREAAKQPALPPSDVYTMTPEEEAQVEDLLRRAEYPRPVAQLLTRGKPDPEKWDDYRAWGIRPRHIPDLIRMATDRELNQAPSMSTLVWAPIHAWRALGELRAVQAVEPLLGMLRNIEQDHDEWLGEELSQVFGMIGPATLPALDAYLADARHPLSARIRAAQSIQRVAEEHPDARAECVGLLTRALERFGEQDPTLNAFIISPLVELQAVEAADVIQRAYAARRVDESILGDWEDAQVELGLKAARAKPKRSGWFNLFGKK